MTPVTTVSVGNYTERTGTASSRGTPPIHCGRKSDKRRKQIALLPVSLVSRRVFRDVTPASRMPHAVPHSCRAHWTLFVAWSSSPRPSASPYVKGLDIGHGPRYSLRSPVSHTPMRRFVASYPDAGADPQAHVYVTVCIPAPWRSLPVGARYLRSSKAGEPCQLRIPRPWL